MSGPSDAWLESHLYSSLARLELTHWNHVFANIALHYRGLEDVADVVNSPLQQLHAVIRQAEALPREWRDRALFDGITLLSVWHHHAQNESGLWHPLNESLYAFRSRGQRTILWSDETPHPSAIEVAHWLRRVVARPL